MIYRLENIRSGTHAGGVRWMMLLYWLQADDGELLAREEMAQMRDGVWDVRVFRSMLADTYAELPLAELVTIIKSQELRELAWREGAVEFAVARHPDTGDGEIYVQAKLALGMTNDDQA